MLACRLFQRGLANFAMLRSQIPNSKLVDKRYFQTVKMMQKIQTIPLPEDDIDEAFQDQNFSTAEPTFLLMQSKTIVNGVMKKQMDRARQESIRIKNRARAFTESR